MTAFLYYLPGKTRALTLEEAHAAGLRHAFECKPTACEVLGGPDKGRGAIVADSNRVARITYDPKRQTWRKIPGGQGAYCGMYNDDPPKPEDLQQDTTVAGKWITMANGQQYHAPTIHTCKGGETISAGIPTVPRKLELLEDGRWVHGAIQPDYEAAWKVAVEFFWKKVNAIADAMDAEQDSAEWTLTDAINNALTILRVNYRVSAIEASMLGLMSDAVAIEILDVGCDWQAAIELAKKKGADGASTDAGPADGTTDTGQQ